MQKAILDKIDRSARAVFDVMAPRVSSEDLQRIRKAYRFAFDAHDGQMRQSGDPYIIHPVAVARIAAEELVLDANTVVAAFLHDVVEDTPHTIEEIREEFGDDVAFLVDVVTKRRKEVYESSKQIDNFKQMLDSVHYDIRALLVKLSDRLHNMRTLDSMKPDKQMRIAGETDFFYAPLAGRLGLYFVKSELENLSFRFRCPREFDVIEKQLEVDRERTAATVKAFTDKIDSLLAEKGILARTQVRYRKPYSIWRNMIEAGCDFSHVEYKHYVRVIYTPQGEWSEKDVSLFIYSVLSSNFKERPGSVTNYIDSPKDNGYQSFHVKFLNDAGYWEELHISSERMVLNSKLGCIVERGETWLERFQSVLKDIAASTDSLYFMEDVSSSLYNEDIIAFTPKGKGIILPKGATALDFAFEVHTRIGEQAQYARINGKLCPVKTELHRGDCVEIGVNPNVKPTAEWLGYVNTFRAKRCLHDYLRRQAAPAYRCCPLCHPLPGDEVIGFKDADGGITLHSRHCPDAIRLASGKGESIVAVNFESDPNLLYQVILKVKAVDRYHLLRDIVDCFVEERHLSIGRLEIESEDQIVTATIGFAVHSAQELQDTIRSLASIEGVDEVQRTDN